MQLSLQHLVYHLVELVYHLHQPVRYTPSIDQIFSADYLKYEILHGYNKLFSKSIDVLIHISIVDQFLFAFVHLVLVFLYIPQKFPVIVLYAPVTLMMSILLILYHALSSYVPPLVTLINFIASMFDSLNVLYCLLLKQNVCIYPCFTLIIRMIRSVIIPVSEQ